MDHIRVLLTGGPAALTDAAVIDRVTSLSDSVKVNTGNGYEHYRYSGESREFDGSRLPVFAWCTRTRVAE